MSINKGMDKGISIPIIEEYYSAIKKNEIMPYAATWMDLEITILSEVREWKTSYDTAYMWNIKKRYK